MRKYNYRMVGMENAKGVAKKLGEYALKAVSYPILGALPERSQNYLEKRFESYDKFDATAYSGMLEGFTGIFVAGSIAPFINPIAGAILFLYLSFEGMARCGFAMAAEESLQRRAAYSEDAPLMRTALAVEAEKSARPPEVYGSLLAKIIAEPIYCAYDNLAGPMHGAYDKILERFRKNKE